MTVLLTIFPLTPNFHLSLCNLLKNYQGVLCTSPHLSRARTEAKQKGQSLRQPYLSVHLTQAENADKWRTGQEPQREELPWFGQTQVSVLNRVFLRLSLPALYRFKTMSFTLWILALLRFPASWLLTLCLLLLTCLFTVSSKFYYIYMSKSYRIVVPPSL